MEWFLIKKILKKNCFTILINSHMKEIDKLIYYIIESNSNSIKTSSKDSSIGEKIIAVHFFVFFRGDFEN
jgi:hypothetical protein